MIIPEQKEESTPEGMGALSSFDVSQLLTVLNQVLAAQATQSEGGSQSQGASHAAQVTGSATTAAGSTNIAGLAAALVATLPFLPASTVAPPVVTLPPPENQPTPPARPAPPMPAVNLNTSQSGANQEVPPTRSNPEPTAGLKSKTPAAGCTTAAAGGSGGGGDGEGPPGAHIPPAPDAAGPSNRWYVVTRGLQVGVFSGWPTVQPFISGVSNACYQRYPSYYEAVAAFQAAVNAELVSILP